MPAVKKHFRFVSVIEAVDRQLEQAASNLHNDVLRPFVSREIYTALAIIVSVELTPAEAHVIAKKWKNLPDQMRHGPSEVMLDDEVERMLRELASR